MYILHDTNPITFDIAYLKEINDNSEPTDNDMDNPESLTLWLEASDFDARNLNTDSIFIFQTNNINGNLGALQIADEAIVATLETTTKVVTTKHPVVFSSINEADPPVGDFLNYGWLWKYDEFGAQQSMMKFCFKDQGDVSWHPVYFAQDSFPQHAYVSGDYCYLWQKSMLYRYDGSEWAAINEST